MRLYQSVDYRSSMTCLEVGYHGGQLFKAFLNFNVPTSIETGNVDAEEFASE